MTELINAADFLYLALRRMRFGDLSREPLQLLRLEWKESAVECDWLMRAPDAWDRVLPPHVAQEHQSLQALRDALKLRDLVFAAFPKVAQAKLNMFRQQASSGLELMLSGTVHRANEVLHRVPSVAMRARLCGFEFSLAEGVLETRGRVSCG